MEVGELIEQARLRALLEGLEAELASLKGLPVQEARARLLEIKKRRSELLKSMKPLAVEEALTRGVKVERCLELLKESKARADIVERLRSKYREEAGKLRRVIEEWSATLSKALAQARGDERRVLERLASQASSWLSHVGP